jgi:hypothetical protein
MVSHRAARLIRRLHRPGPLPAEVRRDHETSIRTVAGLVLDGVLQVQLDGTVLPALGVHELLFPGRQVPVDSLGVLADLSLDAVRYACSLDIDRPATLARRLYGYGRLPACPNRHGKLRTPMGVAAHYGLQQPEVRALLQRSWVAVPKSPDGTGDGWLAWRPSTGRREADWQQRAPLHKLYLSPALEGMSQAFRAALTEAGDEACGVKIGADLWRVLQPDKIVIHYMSAEAAQAGAERLAAALGRLEPHGVPFTAASTDSGLVSTGGDRQGLDASGHWSLLSWRTWVTDHLADGILIAKAHGADISVAARFTLDRLRLHGIDVDRWEPLTEEVDTATAIDSRCIES